MGYTKRCALAETARSASRRQRGSRLAAVAATMAIAFTTAACQANYTLKTLASFSTGAFPDGGLTIGSGGVLYGTTYSGGSSNTVNGTVFKYAPGVGLTTLHTFDGADGQNPESGLAMDSSGNLYGTTFGGGQNGDGTIFEVSSAGTFSTVASFDGTNGRHPEHGIAVTSGGQIYGTAAYGGANGYGVLYSIQGGGSIQVLANFAAASTGSYPSGRPLVANGSAIGTNSSGSSSAIHGTVFAYSSSTATISTFALGGASSGADPSGGVIIDKAGNLYGTASYGGTHNDGTIFKVGANGIVSALATFDGTNGAKPVGTLVMDAAGNLFGTTTIGGAYNQGTAFEVTPNGTIITLASFQTATGGGPFAGLVMDSHGNLFGTTYEGGTFNAGTIFELVNVPEPAAILPLALALLSVALLKRRAR